jgi:hypothetical protein
VVGLFVSEVVISAIYLLFPTTSFSLDNLIKTLLCESCDWRRYRHFFLFELNHHIWRIHPLISKPARKHRLLNPQKPLRHIGCIAIYQKIIEKPKAPQGFDLRD